jgi:hypothetical protein
MKKSVRGLALLSTAAVVLGTGAVGSADASVARATGQQVLAKGVPSPLSLAVAKDGSAYVSANFAGMLWHVAKGKAPEVLYQSKEKNAEVGGVSRHKKTLTFTVTGKNKVVKQIKNGGKPTNLADVGKYEASKNPDKGQTYGLQGATADCVAQWPEKDLGPATYTGIVDSHPYSTYTTGKGVYVGEAAGNDVLWVGNDGKIKTVAVLPPTTIAITAEAAAANKIPACAVGLDYNLEPVPTDVELGPDGWLYVSSLPGGPEDPSLGFNGRVYKVNPKTGKVKLVAGGFLSTVDLAVANNGDVYVAELFAGAVKRIKAGKHVAKPFLQLTQPGAIEATKGYLYATDNALIGQKNPKGKVIRVKW